MHSKLNVQAIFDSIDGEANAFDGAGQLCTFIRLKGCNLRCQACDTSYSQGTEPPNWMTIGEIIEKIQFPKVTITGGEPGLQQEMLRRLCSELIFRRYETGIPYKISIETNGTFLVDTLGSLEIRAVVDYKLPSSGMEEEMNSEAFRYLRKSDVIKFVIADEYDYKYALTVIDQNPSWIARKVFSPVLAYKKDYNPQYVSVPKVLDMQWPRQLVSMMLRDKVDAQFSLQLHKVLWPGAKEER